MSFTSKEHQKSMADTDPYQPGHMLSEQMEAILEGENKIIVASHPNPSLPFLYYHPLSHMGADAIIKDLDAIIKDLETYEKPLAFLEQTLLWIEVSREDYQTIVERDWQTSFVIPHRVKQTLEHNPKNQYGALNHGVLFRRGGPTTRIVSSDLRRILRTHGGLTAENDEDRADRHLFAINKSIRAYAEEPIPIGLQNAQEWLNFMVDKWHRDMANLRETSPKKWMQGFAQTKVNQAIQFCNSMGLFRCRLVSWYPAEGRLNPAKVHLEYQGRTFIVHITNFAYFERLRLTKQEKQKIWNAHHHRADTWYCGIEAIKFFDHEQWRDRFPIIKCAPGTRVDDQSYATAERKLQTASTLCVQTTVERDHPVIDTQHTTEDVDRRQKRWDVLVKQMDSILAEKTLLVLSCDHPMMKPVYFQPWFCVPARILVENLHSVNTDTSTSFYQESILRLQLSWEDFDIFSRIAQARLGEYDVTGRPVSEVVMQKLSHSHKIYGTLCHNILLTPDAQVTRIMSRYLFELLQRYSGQEVCHTARPDRHLHAFNEMLRAIGTQEPSPGLERIRQARNWLHDEVDAWHYGVAQTRHKPSRSWLNGFAQTKVNQSIQFSNSMGLFTCVLVAWYQTNDRDGDAVLHLRYRNRSLVVRIESFAYFEDPDLTEQNEERLWETHRHTGTSWYCGIEAIKFFDERPWYGRYPIV